MVQKKKNASPPLPAAANEPKRRGRPRAYQPEVALGKALELFRKDGFAGTSLDDLSAVTGMNRPSLYGALGDDRHLQGRTADPQTAGADLRGGARYLSQRRDRATRLLHGDDRGVGSGVRSGNPRARAGGTFRARQGLCQLLPAGEGAGRIA